MYSATYIRTSIILLLFASLLAFCTSRRKDLRNEIPAVPVQVITSQGVSVPIFDFKAFRPMLYYNTDTLYVINFWATWCKPCVKELPHFSMADSIYAAKPVRIILVSLDFIENVEDGLIPFMIENRVKAEVVLLDDMDANSWIPQVDPNWEGAIPATLFRLKSNRKFEMRSYHFEELTNEIDNFLNQ